MRLFTYPRPTVAAINGHAFAGGLITAAVCDHRIAITGDASFGLNEVPIGIPMPAVYVRMLAYASGEPGRGQDLPARAQRRLPVPGMLGQQRLHPPRPMPRPLGELPARPAVSGLGQQCADVSKGRQA